MNGKQLKLHWYEKRHTEHGSFNNDHVPSRFLHDSDTYRVIRGTGKKAGHKKGHNRGK